MKYNPLKHAYRRFNWKSVWEKKGVGDSNDLKELNGYGATSIIDMKMIANKISKELKLKPSDKVLEVGCGAGAIAEHLDCDYEGIDYAKSLIAKFKYLVNKGIVRVAPADLLPFSDDEFDKVFAYSVFHYFPTTTYTSNAIAEMKRVCKPGGIIFIGDLPTKDSFEGFEHQLFDRKMIKEFEGWKITEGYHDKTRFNVWRKNDTKDLY